MSDQYTQMTMFTNFEEVARAYRHFEIHNYGGPPHHIPRQHEVFRLRALQEELTELNDGYKNHDLEAIADALVDLVVFALGTAVVHDLPWEPLFAEVMRANMEKIPGEGNKFRRVDGVVDLLKPDNWRPPDILRTLQQHGWRGEDPQ